MAKEEFCIMPENPYYDTVRTDRTVRHEVFFGRANRQKSIEYGLVVFLTPELHNMSNKGVHFNREFDLYLKRIGQKKAMEYYDWTIDDFRGIFGKSWL